jgi:hypothetical protein
MIPAKRASEIPPLEPFLKANVVENMSTSEVVYL